MTESVAIVGGTGFLGRHVVAALQRAGYETRALSRRTGFNARRPDPEPLRGCSAVVNLVGVKREEGEQTFQAVHVDAVGRLIEAMRTACVPRLVHVSVVAAREGPGLPYNHTKWRGEEAVRASGLEWTILRPGVIYGVGDDMLSHLTMMIRASAVFPIVNDGSSPMMPVDANDVAAAVVGALQSPASRGTVYEVVGPDRLTLRDVVSRVAEANDLPVRIWGTPVALMRVPVRIMEAVMEQPLSTRAQLALLVEGLAGDPGPARRDLGVAPVPFTPDRLRPIVAGIVRRAPFDLRLLTAPKSSRETPAPAAWGLWALAAAAFTFVLLGVRDVWTGLACASSVAAAGALFLPSVRRRVRPSRFRVAAGLVAGGALYLAALAFVRVLGLASSAEIRTLYAWKGDHSLAYLLATMLVTTATEELLWRGVVARFAMERLGRVWGLLAGAGLYALGLGASANPVLLAAALLCGLYWGWLYAATDDLVAPVVCHAAFDALALFVVPLATPA
mgnify:CR=1 FL=1